MKDNDKEDNVYLMEDWTRTMEDGVEAASPASRRSPGGGHWVPCDVESGEGRGWGRNQGGGIGGTRGSVVVWSGTVASAGGSAIEGSIGGGLTTPGGMPTVADGTEAGVGDKGTTPFGGVGLVGKERGESRSGKSGREMGWTEEIGAGLVSTGGLG